MKNVINKFTFLVKKNFSLEIKKLESQKIRLQDDIDKLKNNNKILENNFQKLNDEYSNSKIFVYTFFLCI